MLNKKYIPVALILIGVGIILSNGMLPVLNDQVIAVVIIEETKDRSLLPDSQVALLASNSFLDTLKSKNIEFLGCFDKDVKHSQTLDVFFMATVNAEKLPLLGIRYKSERVRIVPLPLTEEEAVKAIQ